MKKLFLFFFVIQNIQILAQDSTNIEKIIPETQSPVINETVPYEPSESEIRYYEAFKKDKTKGSNSDIKTLNGSLTHSGGFFGLSFRSSEFENETLVLAGIRTGWIINRTLGIGFEGHGIFPTADFQGIDPDEDVILLGGYGGMFLEPILFSNQVIHLTFPVSAGSGWLGYTLDWEEPQSGNEDDLISDDVFWYLETGANVEINISRHFRLAVGASKRFSEDLELLNTDENAFDQPNYFITLKFGRF